MICDFSGIVTEGFTIPKTVFSKYIFVEKCVDRVIQVELFVFDH